MFWHITWISQKYSTEEWTLKMQMQHNVEENKVTVTVRDFSSLLFRWSKQSRLSKVTQGGLSSRVSNPLRRVLSWVETFILLLWIPFSRCFQWTVTCFYEPAGKGVLGSILLTSYFTSLGNWWGRWGRLVYCCGPEGLLPGTEDKVFQEEDTVVVKV